MYPETILPIAAHIPHAGTEVPNSVRDQFLSRPDELWREIIRVTDWYTDELFGIPGTAICQTPISRVVVDLERYIDDGLEENAAFGQGVIYAHNTLGGKIRRQISDQERSLLLDNYYRPWHLTLELNIEQQLARWGHCLLLDCHSFPDEPFGHEGEEVVPRPDICLGLNADNTHPWLLKRCVSLFEHHGYSVRTDGPYAGCLVPHKHLGDERVPAITLEINRRLYLQTAEQETYGPGDKPIKSGAFDAVRNDIWSIVLLLAKEATCRAPA